MGDKVMGIVLVQIAGGGILHVMGGYILNGEIHNTPWVESSLASNMVLEGYHLVVQLPDGSEKILISCVYGNQILLVSMKRYLGLITRALVNVHKDDGAKDELVTLGVTFEANAA